MPLTFQLKKEDALRLYPSQAALARALDISRAAVNRWPDGLPIPEQYALRIRYVLNPQAFPDDPYVVETAVDSMSKNFDIDDTPPV